MVSAPDSMIGRVAVGLLARLTPSQPTKRILQKTYDAGT